MPDYKCMVELEAPLTEKAAMTEEAQDPRQAWQAWCKAFDRWGQAHQLLPQFSGSGITLIWGTRDGRPGQPLPPIPASCRGMVCGARTRTGTAYQRKDVWNKAGRCRLHGGCSTGPKTAEGKRRAAFNGLRPKRKRTP